jgi:HPt (histidine-containing phosphotransfer) domain-containing protein
MDDDSALDASALASLRALDAGVGDRLREILEIFVDDGYGLLLRIEEAAASRNARRLESAARQLSGSGANVGAAVLAAVCMELQQRGARGELSDLAGTLAALRKAFDRVEAEVHEALAEGH